MRWKRRFLRFHVVDWSMAPSFVPGDRIRVDSQGFVGRSPEKGEVVVIQDPESEGRKLLKRVLRVEEVETGSVLFVLGDNELSSRDSRHFGLVPIDHVIGLVIR